MWRDGSLWTTAQVVPGSGPDAGQATAHWWEIATVGSAPSGYTLVQQGNVGAEDVATGAYTFMPSIAVNAAGDMAIGFPVSSPTTYAGAAYAVRRADDALGTIQDTQVSAPGMGYYLRTFGGTRNRWGDYSGTAVDPRDDLSFFFFNEYAMTPGTPFGGEDGRWATSWAFIKDAATLAELRGFRALTESDVAAIEWTTGMEVGTLGFHVERWDDVEEDWMRLTEEALPSLKALGLPQGGSYRFEDPGAWGGETHQYRLVEEEIWGGERVHGPFDVTFPGRAPGIGVGRASALAPASGAVARSDGGAAIDTGRFRAAARTLERSVYRDRMGRWTPRGGPAKLRIAADGLYQVSSASIAAALGRSKSRVERWIKRGRLALWCQGQVVAWEAMAGNRGIRFYGEAPEENPYTDEQVCLLDRGRGRRMSEADARPAAVVDQQVIRAEQHVEEDRFAATEWATDPESDYWRWVLLQGGASWGKLDIGVELQHLVGADASLRLDLQGIRAVGHRLRIRVNGHALDEDLAWHGIGDHTERLTIPAGMLVEGANLIRVEALPGAGGTSYVYLDGIAIGYERYAVAIDGVLEAEAPANGVLSMDGFATGEVAVYELGPGLARLTDVQVDQGLEGVRVSFAAKTGVRYLAVQAGSAQPLEAEPTPAVAFRRSDRADYLIISERGLSEGAQAMASLRTASGLATKIVYIDEIDIAMNHGMQSPHNIRAFLDAWAEPWGVRYVLLAGEACHDHKDLLGLCQDLVPTPLVPTPYGLFACDSCQGSMAIGRVPAASSAELSAYAAKIAAYEAALPTERRALLVADHDDRKAGYFSSDSDALAIQLAEDVPDVRVEKLYLDDIPLGTARSTLFARLSEAGVWSNFIGHGGGTTLSKSDLLVGGDSARIAGGSGILAAMTCAANWYDSPYWRSLGEELAMDPDGGPVAVFGPSGLSQNALAVQLNATLLDEALTLDRPTLGDAGGATMCRNAGLVEWMRQIYNTIGDPYLVLP